jgi:hypothetical protein
MWGFNWIARRLVWGVAEARPALAVQHGGGYLLLPIAVLQQASPPSDTEAECSPVAHLNDQQLFLR